jgi:hypothetical protein
MATSPDTLTRLPVVEQDAAGNASHPERTPAYNDLHAAGAVTSRGHGLARNDDAAALTIADKAHGIATVRGRRAALDHGMGRRADEQQ